MSKEWVAYDDVDKGLRLRLSPSSAGKGEGDSLYFGLC